MARKTERRHRQGNESRQRILEAALSLATELGYEGTSLRLITERARVSASSVYWHFGSKDDLLAEALEFSYRTWRRDMAEMDAPAMSGSPRERVRRNLGLATTSAGEAEFWRLGLLLALENRAEEPAARLRFREVRREVLRTMEDAWARQVTPEQLLGDPGLPARLASCQLMLLDGLFVGGNADAAWDADALIDVLIGGLLAAVSGATEGTT